jgi:hypothetical protein
MKMNAPTMQDGDLLGRVGVPPAESGILPDSPEQPLRPASEQPIAVLS